MRLAKTLFVAWFSYQNVRDQKLEALGTERLFLYDFIRLGKVLDFFCILGTSKTSDINPEKTEMFGPGERSGAYRP